MVDFRTRVRSLEFVSLVFKVFDGRSYGLRLRLMRGCGNSIGDNGKRGSARQLVCQPAKVVRLGFVSAGPLKSGSFRMFRFRSV